MSQIIKVSFTIYDFFSADERWMQAFLLVSFAPYLGTGTVFFYSLGSWVNERA